MPEWIFTQILIMFTFTKVIPCGINIKAYKWKLYCWVWNSYHVFGEEVEARSVEPLRPLVTAVQRLVSRSKHRALNFSRAHGLLGKQGPWLAGFENKHCTENRHWVSRCSIHVLVHLSYLWSCSPNPWVRHPETSGPASLTPIPFLSNTNPTSP